MGKAPVFNRSKLDKKIQELREKYNLDEDRILEVVKSAIACTAAQRSEVVSKALAPYLKDIAKDATEAEDRAGSRAAAVQVMLEGISLVEIEASKAYVIMLGSMVSVWPNTSTSLPLFSESDSLEQKHAILFAGPEGGAKPPSLHNVTEQKLIDLLHALRKSELELQRAASDTKDRVKEFFEDESLLKYFAYSHREYLRKEGIIVDYANREAADLYGQSAPSLVACESLQRSLYYPEDGGNAAAALARKSKLVLDKTEKSDRVENLRKVFKKKEGIPLRDADALEFCVLNSTAWKTRGKDCKDGTSDWFKKAACGPGMSSSGVPGVGRPKENATMTPVQFLQGLATGKSEARKLYGSTRLEAMHLEKLKQPFVKRAAWFIQQD